MTHSKPISKTIAVIGAGHMGACLIGGLINKGHAPDSIWVSDPNSDKLQALKNEFQVQVTSENKKAIQSADFIILAVKPKQVLPVIRELSEIILNNKPLVISIAAGIRTKSLEKILGTSIPIIRAMPNTASLIGCGVTGVFANPLITPAHREATEELLEAFGSVVWINKEDWMDSVTALSSSGLAYFFRLMETFIQAGAEMGLPPEVSENLTLQTAYGAALMALESGLNVAELRKRVISKGGTTEAAFKVMEEHHLTDIYKKALLAAKNRSEEMSTEFEDH